VKAGEKGESKKRKQKNHYSLLFREFDEFAFSSEEKAG
jgi:hypothetical protein